MTQRIGSKGQVVIPKGMRDRLGLHPGTEVEFELEHERVVLVRRRGDAGRPGGQFAGSGMAARLLEDRLREPQ